MKETFAGFGMIGLELPLEIVGSLILEVASGVLKNCGTAETSSKKDWSKYFGAGVDFGQTVKKFKNLRKNESKNDQNLRKMTTKNECF